MRDVLLVHYTEIGTKGKNRSFFERRLRDDLQRRLGAQATGVRVESSRVIAELADGHDKTAVSDALNKVFGVAWYSFAERVPREWPDMLAAGLRHAEAGVRRGARTFKVFAKRADKAYALSSQEICNRLGAAVVEKHGLKVDLENHDLAIHVEVLPDCACVYSEKRPGLRGMPSGSSGQLLCLFSGGIDSPVAAYRLMRRGATVHLLHFHPFRKAEDLVDTKIFALHKVLRAYNPKCLLFLVPHYHYQVKAALEIPSDYEMVLFRRFIFRAAEALARKRRMKALVTGDCLGQVASQTLENLTAAQSDLGIPVFLPLISFDKEDIVREAQQIGTYDLSILPYKDCCSLLSRHPKTMTAVERVRRMEEKLDFAPLIEESLKAIEVWDGERFLPAPSVRPVETKTA